MMTVVLRAGADPNAENDMDGERPLENDTLSPEVSAEELERWPELPKFRSMKIARLCAHGADPAFGYGMKE